MNGIIDKNRNPFVWKDWAKKKGRLTVGRQDELQSLFKKSVQQVISIGVNKGRYPAFTGIRWGFAELKDGILLPTIKWDDRHLYDGFGNHKSGENIDNKKHQEKVIAMGNPQVKSICDEFSYGCSSMALFFSKSLIQRFVSGLQSKRFLLLTGLSGSGKTKLAQSFAQWMTPIFKVTETFAPGTKIPSSQKTYIVNRADSISVEFRNHEDANDATVVTLPRDMIREWADFILRNALDENVTAREIRSGVVQFSKYSSQLHSFETHLKAAAFALLKAQLISHNSRCYEIIPVGADWTSNENILGYPNGLDERAYNSTPALSLILRALDPANLEVPHFLILDEMNLSHVERYFADLLSAIESGEAIPLYEGAERNANGVPIPKELRLPPNLFIIGTVNVDETTYMFSPKVLDRANVIEFRMDNEALALFLDSPDAPDLEALSGEGAEYGASFVQQASTTDVSLPESIRDAFKEEMLLFFGLLQEHNAEFGFRVAHESARFIYYYHLLGGYEDGNNEWFTEAMDAVIVQKILPKFHGSRSQLEGLLWSLSWACGAPREELDGIDFRAQLREAGKAQDEGTYGPETLWDKLAQTNEAKPYLVARYPLSYEKVMRMWRKLVRDQFVSFAEA